MTFLYTLIEQDNEQKRNDAFKAQVELELDVLVSG